MVWNFGSAGVGAMALFNVIVILLLSKPGIRTLQDYEAQKKMGLDPVFVPERIGIQHAELWHQIVARSYPDQLAALEAKVTRLADVSATVGAPYLPVSGGVQML